MESLWRNRQFMRLWFSSVISGLGNRVTAVAIPLTAAVTLEASPAQMAMLTIASQLPDVIFGLLAGSWIDRGRHRFFLVGSDWGRGLLLATIPLAAFLGILNLHLLIAVSFLTGILSVFAAVVSVAVLPAVVKQDQLIAANARLTATNAMVSFVGPSFAGALIQVVSAPKAILFDAFSFAASALSVRGIGGADRRSAPQSIWRDVREGLEELIETPILRALTLSSAVFAIGLSITTTIQMLFLTRTLGLSGATIGIVLGAGGIGSIAGSFLAQRAASHLGVGRSIIIGTSIEAIAALLIPVSVLTSEPAVPLLAGFAINGVGFSIYSVNHVSLRQRIVAPHKLGRITAGRRFITFALAPVGAILGAWLGEVAGLTEAMLAAAVFFTLGTCVMAFSPVRTAR